MIQQTFEAVIMVELLPRSEIYISIEALQSDGDMLCAAMNVATLALVNAGVPMKAFVTACSAGWIEEQAVLDTNQSEQNIGGGHVYVAILCPAVERKSGMEVDVMDLDRASLTSSICMSKMEGKMECEHLEETVELACRGCEMLHQIMHKEIEKYTISRLSTRGLLNNVK